METVLVIRHGALGDALQASSILPALKEMGLHVTVETEASGELVFRNNPNVDEMIVLKPGQIPVEKMPDHWVAVGAAYDHVVNLSHVVEGALLKQRTDMAYYWPDAARRALCDRNYVETLHLVAGVPMPCRQKFYPTTDEMVAAGRRLFSPGPVVLVALSGSTAHKRSPWNGQLATLLLHRHPTCRIVFTGTPADAGMWAAIERQVAAGYGETDRVEAVLDADIRTVFAMAILADVVVGPETGVLNAVAMEENHKVVVLSHSTVTNLTRDWVNTTSLTPDPDAVSCYPCHRLHFTDEFCRKDPVTGAAACMAAILPPQLLPAILDGLSKGIGA